MTIGPEQRNADFNSQQAASQKNAAMRGEHAPGFDANYILEARCVRLNSENIDLRGQLEMARKATSAAQELLEAERQENAALNDKLINAEDARTANASSALDQIGRIKELRLLRTNDAATIADLQRRLREAESQLAAQREAAPRMYIAARGQATVAQGYWHDIQALQATIRQLRAQIETMPVTVRGEPTVARRILEAENAELEKMVLAKNDEIAKLDKQLKARRLSAESVAEIRADVPYGDRVARAENVELRRTISLMAKTAAEVQDNFRLIAELAADPADEARKENTK